ncbi:aminoglycoside phosphotransferase [Sphingomonas sp. Leaf407]|uniref:aminoglycoside phosphotransferase family protein n=1 Tax=unclassified Sphingomonas TaxID=196159 RepID=UPI0006F4F001|nr:MULTISPECIES: phosphotransferase [unclassified Sphingomonas]KQN40682.1 aminoglycoside phosphotransferase [Sphingomonas sp. Leaf42]KQT30038.1 aminoglycoside phosphotransferase [Sphingomonas sp. Leaf407]
MAADLNPRDAASAFLTAAGWGDARVVPLAVDASFRRYYRVEDGARSAVLMDAPPPEDTRKFATMAAWLTDRDFPAPAILADDPDAGFMLVEDFGDDRMREALDVAPERGGELYAAAVDQLLRLQQHEAAPVPPYDRAFILREADLMIEWYCGALNLTVDAAGYRAAWDRAFDAIEPMPVTTVLRDYHAENLMLLADDRLGLLDFQDALAGHPAYDLMSLLQDARRDVSPEIETAMLARYRAATGAGEGFDVAYHLFGAQRNAKILGIFTRLWRRDGKLRYGVLCPRVWAYLERDLRHPALADLTRWFDDNIPADRRGNPQEIA